MTGPAASVVVATYQRAHLLPRLVAAVDRQEGAGDVELVVVDDGSTDGTHEVLARLAAAAGRVRVVPVRMEANRGPAAARNAGWRAAGAPVVAFTDDDCVPQPGWLARLVAALGDADLAQGTTVPDPGQAAAVGPFARWVEVRGEGGFYETCNMAYRRDVLERLGGFDERFRHPAGEDVDLAWRAKETGARSVFVRDAVVHHDVAPSRLVDRVRDARRLEGTTLVVRAHPQLRAYFGGRVLYRQSHGWALLAAAGLAGALRGRRALGLAAAVPYVWHRLRVAPLPGPSPRRELAIPGALVVDLAEVAALARASARHRTLVL